MLKRGSVLAVTIAAFVCQLLAGAELARIASLLQPRTSAVIAPTDSHEALVYDAAGARINAPRALAKTASRQPAIVATVLFSASTQPRPMTLGASAVHTDRGQSAPSFGRAPPFDK